MDESRDSKGSQANINAGSASSQYPATQVPNQSVGQVDEVTEPPSVAFNSKDVSSSEARCSIKGMTYFERRDLCLSLFSFLLGIVSLGAAIYIATNEISSLNSSITQQTATDVYSVGLQTSTLLIENPELRKYFEDVNDFFSAKAIPRNLVSGFRTKSQRDEQWRIQREKAENALKNETPKTRAKVWSYAEFLADFLELAFVNRNLLQPDDWKSWWYYICDQYDGSAALREYCRVRGGEDARKWYSFVDEVNKSDAERERFLQSETDHK